MRIRSIDERALPVLTAEDAEAARQAIAVYRDLPASTSDSTIDRMMGALAMAYPSQRVSDEEAEMRLTVYARGLQDVPPDLLRGAFSDAVRVHKFFPSVAELRALAYKRPMGEHRWRLTVLERLVEAYDAAANAAAEPVFEGWTAERLRGLPIFAARCLRKSGAITIEMFDEAFPSVEASEGEA